MDINNEVNKNKIISEDDLFMSEDDSENEWSSQDFIQAVNAAEADDDDSEEDDWDNDINELNEVEAEKVKKESTEKAAESAKADDDEEKNKSLLVLLDQELKDDFENEWSTQAEADDDNSKEDDWDDYINERGWNEVEAEKVKKESTETKVEESVNKRKKKPSISPVTKKKQKLEKENQKDAKSRRMPCRKCPRCLAPKCRECKMCLNPKFKKPCINRTCFSKLEPKKDEDKEKAAEEKLALLDIELKDDKEDNESDPDTPIFDEIDEKNDEKAKNDVKKSQLAEEDNDPDGWGEYINQIIKGKKHHEIDEENDEQAKEKYNEKPKNEASTSTGRKNHDGIPTGRQKVPYLLSDLCKPKNPITSKGMKKPFKGVAIC